MESRESPKFEMSVQFVPHLLDNVHCQFCQKTLLILMGCRQAVRHRTLTPGDAGPNPASPVHIFLPSCSRIGIAPVLKTGVFGHGGSNPSDGVKIRAALYVASLECWQSRLIALEIANPELRIVAQRFESSTLQFMTPGNTGQNPASQVHIFCRLVAELVLHRS